ncbi:hypothetical protein Q4493_02050 [Colwellia sp. 1_MG-2023]|uniref:hypothetical protein n=1 Tax=Colwellia sp. 1_MG-2023 TaxID=3062649 RepID=UPI0026E38FFD|nr:hypothetical protein [Colwellia sp. 1_MG-2023]MDO6444549.1 hypothetical protein [Colwellia sp. 1_MG-2023]
MSKTKRKLLDSNDSTTLYKLTNPKIVDKPNLHVVIRPSDGDWLIEDSHILRGYAGSQRSLESKVNRYESSNIWPNQCELGIGVYINGNLNQVLVAKNLGRRPVPKQSSSLPLDDIHGVVGLTRDDIYKPD